MSDQWTWHDCTLWTRCMTIFDCHWPIGSIVFDLIWFGCLSSAIYFTATQTEMCNKIHISEISYSGLFVWLLDPPYLHVLHSYSHNVTLVINIQSFFSILSNVWSKTALIMAVYIMSKPSHSGLVGKGRRELNAQRRTFIPANILFK